MDPLDPFDLCAPCSEKLVDCLRIAGAAVPPTDYAITLAGSKFTLSCRGAMIDVEQRNYSKHDSAAEHPQKEDADVSSSKFSARLEIAVHPPTLHGQGVKGCAVDQPLHHHHHQQPPHKRQRADDTTSSLNQGHNACPYKSFPMDGSCSSGAQPLLRSTLHQLFPGTASGSNRSPSTATHSPDLNLGLQSELSQVDSVKTQPPAPPSVQGCRNQDIGSAADLLERLSCDDASTAPLPASATAPPSVRETDARQEVPAVTPHMKNSESSRVLKKDSHLASNPASDTSDRALNLAPLKRFVMFPVCPLCTEQLVGCCRRAGKALPSSGLDVTLAGWDFSLCSDREAVVTQRHDLQEQQGPTTEHPTVWASAHTAWSMAADYPPSRHPSTWTHSPTATVAGSATHMLATNPPGVKGGTPQPTPEAHGGRSSAERTERAASSMGHVRPESVTAASTSSSEATDVPGLREEIDLSKQAILDQMLAYWNHMKTGLHGTSQTDWHAVRKDLRTRIQVPTCNLVFLSKQIHVATIIHGLATLVKAVPCSTTPECIPVLGHPTNVHSLPNTVRREGRFVLGESGDLDAWSPPLASNDSANQLVDDVSGALEPVSVTCTVPAHRPAAEAMQGRVGTFEQDGLNVLVTEQNEESQLLPVHHGPSCGTLDATLPPASAPGHRLTFRDYSLAGCAARIAHLLALPADQKWQGAPAADRALISDLEAKVAGHERDLLFWVDLRLEESSPSSAPAILHHRGQLAAMKEQLASRKEIAAEAVAATAAFLTSLIP